LQLVPKCDYLVLKFINPLNILIMKKELKDFKERALKNLNQIKGGGEDVPIDRDKIKTPKVGKRD
jgi:hypothetical protein